MILVSPDFNRKQKLGGFAKYVPISVPIGIGYLAGYLIKYGKKVKILDEEITRASDEILAEYVKGMERPYIFGFSCLTAGISRGHELAGMVKRIYPDSKVIFGSIHPTVMPEEVLKDRNVDIVVRGEGEETLDILYERIKSGKDYRDIKGISFHDGIRVIHNEDAPLPDIAKIPKFPYHLFEEHKEKYELGFVASSRGCPYSCIFCSQRSISGRRYRFVSSEIVIQSLDELINKYNRSYITFVDDCLLVNKGRVFELCEMIKNRGFHKKAIFDCQARGDKVNDEVLDALKSAGFRTVHFGIETASERLMEMLDKRETVKDVIEGIKMTKKHGLEVSGTFILGLPTETREDRRAAYKLTKDLSLDYVRFNNATPYPGTKLYEMALAENRLNPGKNWENLNACCTFVESPFKGNELAYVPPGVSKDELRHDILKYNLFYSFRPKSIIKILKELTGPAGWFILPKYWYLNIREWAYLTAFAFGILCQFAKIFFYDLATPFRKRR